MTSPADSRYAAAAERFDWRFDAQYQSTVKPYLRWYLRGRPVRSTEPQTIYYMLPEPGADCGCGGGMPAGTPAGYGQPARPSWFNPWKYLDEGAELPPLTTAPKRAGVAVSVKPDRVVTGWVHRDEKPGSRSVLFVKPDPKLASQFVQARVTMKNGRVLAVNRPYDERPATGTLLTAER
ncbi:MAG: hypothetical protein NXI04_10835 [Planctomycetaceae bacterium]|nr:hypothetical protein [Planctomycetaceae bacterium]